MPKADYAVFIGRFQPFHLAHLKVIEEACKAATRPIIVVGSHRAPLSVKNPWTYEERERMIKRLVPGGHVIPVKDYMYNDTMWLTSVQNQIASIVGNSTSVKLFGHFKDDSSYYLNYFPQWELCAQPNYFGINGTDIRTALFEGKDTWEKKVPVSIACELVDFKKDKRFAVLQDEYRYIKNYKKQWAAAPYVPTFVTVDAVVIQDGHVLLVKRGCNPGKGRFALPGGFLEPNETVFRSVIRELKEETKIEVPVPILEKAFKEARCFDHPMRSLRGRTLTHAHLFKLDGGKPLPTVRAADDAAEVFWMPVSELARNEEEFFEDHIHIIEYFVYRV